MSARLSQSASEKIRAIGFLCAMLVVPIHCPTMGADSPDLIIGFQTLVGEGISRLAVPWFFVMSGFFLCRSLMGDDGMMRCWGDSIRKRMLTLVVPYLLWNALYYVFKLGMGKYDFNVLHFLNQIIGYNPYTVPSCGQLWYVRCLFVYVLVAPVFWWLTRRNPWALVLVLYAVWLIGVPQPWRSMQYTDWNYLAFFATGFALAHGAFNRVEVMKWKLCVVVLFVASLTGVVYGAIGRNGNVSLLSTKMMIISGLPTLWFAGEGIVEILRPVQAWWGFSFFIYASHVIFVSLSLKIFAHFLHGVAYDSVGYVGIISVSIACPIALSIIMKKICPRVQALLCGGRT